MKFAHLADMHLGGWREPKLQQLNLETFRKAIEKCIQQKVDFVLIAGDLFDTAMPPIEILEEAFVQFRKLKEDGIKCYIVAGSHDYSVSGKTFLNILEKAGFCHNVALFEEKDNYVELRFFHDGNVLLAGLPGRKAGLERNLFKNLKLLEDIKKYRDRIKIFMLHTFITETKPPELMFVESVDAKQLPEGFDYYAAGHLHEVREKRVEDKIIIYPGPLFPNNFQELEVLKAGNFCIVEINDKTKNVEIDRVTLSLKEVLPIKVYVDGIKPEEAEKKILEAISKQDIAEKVVLLRLIGCIDGKTSDIKFDAINEKLGISYAYIKNTAALTSSELKLELEATQSDNIEQIEKEVIYRYTRQDSSEFFKFVELLMKSLETEKKEGELTVTFEDRLIKDAIKVLNLQGKI